MPAKKISISTVTIPVGKIKALSNEERFCLYVLNHMANELSMLASLVHFSLPMHEDEREFRRGPELAQSIMLFRIAVSKAYEARAVLNRKEISDFITHHVLPRRPEISSKKKAMNKALGAAWVKELRNGLGFHFPEFTHWAKVVRPDDRWVDDHMHHGEHSGNVYFDAPENIAFEWLLSLKDRPPGTSDAAQFDTMVDEMINILAIVKDVIAESLAEFYANTIFDGAIPTTVAGTVLAPEISEVRIPYWTHKADNAPRRRK